MPTRSSWLRSQLGKVCRPLVPSFKPVRVIAGVKRKQGDSRLKSLRVKVFSSVNAYVVESAQVIRITENRYKAIVIRQEDGYSENIVHGMMLKTNVKRLSKAKMRRCRYRGRVFSEKEQQSTGRLLSRLSQRNL